MHRKIGIFFFKEPTAKSVKQAKGENVEKHGASKKKLLDQKDTGKAKQNKRPKEEAVQEQPRKRGRPKGSHNKEKTKVFVQTDESSGTDGGVWKSDDDHSNLNSSPFKKEHSEADSLKNLVIPTLDFSTSKTSECTLENPVVETNSTELPFVVSENVDELNNDSQLVRRSSREFSPSWKVKQSQSSKNFEVNESTHAFAATTANLDDESNKTLMQAASNFVDESKEFFVALDSVNASSSPSRTLKISTNDRVELETARAGTDSEMHALTPAFAKSAAAECIMERTPEQFENETKEKENTLENIVKETQFKEKKSPKPAKDRRRSSKVAAPQDICTPSYKREKSLPRSSPHHSSAQSASRSSGQLIPLNAKLIVEKCSAIPIPAELLVPKFSEQYSSFDDISSDLCSNLSLVSRIVQYKHAVGNFEEAQVFCLKGLQYFRQQGLKLLKRQEELAFPVVSEVVERSDGKSCVPPSEFPLDCELEFVEMAYTVCGLWALYATLLGQCKGKLFNAFDPTSRSLIEQAESSKKVENELLSLRNLFQDLEPVFCDLKEASLTAKPGSLFRAEEIVYKHALCCPVAKLTSSIWIAYARFCVRASAEFGVDDNMPIKTTPGEIFLKGIEAFDAFMPNSNFFVQWKDQSKRCIELQSLLLCDKYKNAILVESPSLTCYWHSPQIELSSLALPVKKSLSSGAKRKSTDNITQSSNHGKRAKKHEVCDKEDDRWMTRVKHIITTLPGVKPFTYVGDSYPLIMDSDFDEIHSPYFCHLMKLYTPIPTVTTYKDISKPISKENIQAYFVACKYCHCVVERGLPTKNPQFWNKNFSAHILNDCPECPVEEREALKNAKKRFEPKKRDKSVTAIFEKIISRIHQYIEKKWAEAIAS